MPLAARSLDITIDRSFASAYDMAHRPETFSKWAAGLASSLRQEGEEWHAETPAGDAVVSFTPHNQFGVLDHRVNIAGKPEIYIPLRMIENGAATLVVFTLFRQPDMDDAAFERDALLVEKDLAALKALLETKGE